MVLVAVSRMMMHATHHIMYGKVDRKYMAHFGSRTSTTATRRAMAIDEKWRKCLTRHLASVENSEESKTNANLLFSVLRAPSIFLLRYVAFVEGNIESRQRKKRVNA